MRKSVSVQPQLHVERTPGHQGPVVRDLPRWFAALLLLGPIIGIAAATIVALATLGGMSMVTKVIILFAIIQIVDNVLIQPVVIAKSVDLHPLVVLVVVMIGSDLWGIVGMLIAVPATGILKVSTQTIYDGVRGYSVT